MAACSEEGRGGCLTPPTRCSLDREHCEGVRRQGSGQRPTPPDQPAEKEQHTADMIQRPEAVDVNR
jgi:hypothetical protein